MSLQLSSCTCSLCEDTDVSLSVADTKEYIRFIKDELVHDTKWENSESFRVCLLCTHSLDLLRDLISGIGKHNVKSCFCCKSTTNLFKHSSLPQNHKSNVSAFASAFDIKGVKMCLHCFYAVNFWFKLTSYLESLQQSNNLKNAKQTLSKLDNGNNHNFEVPPNVCQIPAIIKQIKKIKMLQNKISRKTLRKFSSDKKLVETVPFVFLTRLSQSNIITSIIDISDSSGDDSVSICESKSTKVIDVKSGLKCTRATMKKKSLIQQKLNKATSEESSDSDKSLTIPVRNFKNKPLRVVVSPLKNKQLRPLTKGNISCTDSDCKSTTSKNKKKRNSDSTDESDENDYSVARSGSNTGIVIKRSSRAITSTPIKVLKKKLSCSPLRTIRIQSKNMTISSSSENTDTSTPRSPVTLPPKKNRKRIMDLSDTEYFEPVAAEKRSTRGTMEKKRCDEDVEKNIVSSLEVEASELGRTTRQKTKRKGVVYNLRTITKGEKDAINISSSEEESKDDTIDLSDSDDGPKNLRNIEKSPVKSSEVDNEQSPKSANDKGLKRSYKRIFHKEDDVDDKCSFLEEKEHPTNIENQDKTNNTQLIQINNETQFTMDKIVAKYLDIDESPSQSKNAINCSTQDKTTIPSEGSENEHVDVNVSLDNTTNDTNQNKANDSDETIPGADNDHTQNQVKDPNGNNENKTLEDTNMLNTNEEVERDSIEDALNSLSVVESTEQVNFENSLISPPVDTLDLLECINVEVTKEDNVGKDEDLVHEEQLNLQLTPDHPKNETVANDNKSTVLTSSETESHDIFKLDTQILIYSEDGEEATTKLSSQSSNYQDAIDNVQANEVVNILHDISFTAEIIATATTKDSVEDALAKLHREADTSDSLITEDEMNGDNRTSNKRKRTTIDDNDSVDLQDTVTSDADDTPRTKRVRFSSEKKVLNEDDTVCLENFEGIEEQHEEAAAHENSDELASVSGNNSEALCSPNDI